jgi:hypothetical protein
MSRGYKTGIVLLPITMPFIFVYQTGCKIVDVVFNTEFSHDNYFWGLSKKEREEKNKKKQQLEKERLEKERQEKERLEKEQQEKDHIEDIKQFSINPINRCTKCYKLTKLYIDKDNIKTCEKCQI